MLTGDAITCAIETLAYGGDGLARQDGRVVFIPGTIPGERVKARVTAVKRNFARAELTGVATSSPDRIPPCCRLQDPGSGDSVRVPGCVYDHLAYAAEVAAKQRQLEGFFRRLPHADELAWQAPLASPAPLHYRSKIVLHAERTRGSRVRLGYRQEPSHEVLDTPACPLACPPLNAALAALRASDAFARLPHGADVTFRFTEHDGALWWVGSDPPPMASPDLLTEASAAGPLRVPRDGFFQVNPAVADALVREAAAWFAEGEPLSELLDLYCGVGVFGLACAQARAARLTGIESGRAAVAAARLNAAALGVPATFECRALGAERFSLLELIGAPEHAAVLVDPPRDGLAPDLARALAASGVARLFYVSCDPATLARDLATLLAEGRFRLTRARLFDMFPRTAHFETLVELRRA